MKILGYDFSIKKSLQSVPSAGWYTLIQEGTAGAWQRGETIEVSAAVAHSAVFSCVSAIAGDIAKLPICISEFTGKYWATTSHQFDTLLRQPNAYQNRLQFFSSWLLSKLLTGNTYVLKQRDGLGRITALHIIEPTRVQPLIAEDGAVFYRIAGDDALTATNNLTVPAREIIHDRNITPFHPLVGVSPLTACSLAANQALNIQSGSAAFFKNQSRPSGALIAPGNVTQEQATAIKTDWEAAYSGANFGKVSILAAGLEYKPFSVSAQDSQLIEQLQFSAADVARAFRVPGWKIGAGPSAPYTSSEATNLQYLSDCLQVHIESLELALDQGLDLPATQRTELDESSLLRLDTKTRTDVLAQSVKAGLMTINEARATEGRTPVAGGDQILRQMQDIPLGEPNP